MAEDCSVVKKGYARKTIDELEWTADYVAAEIAREEELYAIGGMSGKCSRMTNEARIKKEELIAYIEQLERLYLGE
jgi:hypothetical protein